MKNKLFIIAITVLALSLLLPGCSVTKIREGDLLEISADNFIGEWEAVGFLNNGNYTPIEVFEDAEGTDYTDTLILNADGTGSIRVEQEGEVAEATGTWEIKEDDKYILYFHLNDGNNTEMCIASYLDPGVSEEPCIARLVDTDDGDGYSIYYKRR